MFGLFLIHGVSQQPLRYASLLRDRSFYHLDSWPRTDYALSLSCYSTTADRSELMILALPVDVRSTHRQLTHRNCCNQLGGSRHHSQPTLHKQAGLLRD